MDLATRGAVFVELLIEPGPVALRETIAGPPPQDMGRYSPSPGAVP